MRYNNNIKGKLSLLYFAVLGLFCYFLLSPMLIIFWILSFINQNFKGPYDFIMVQGIRLYLKLSPLKYEQSLFNLRSINDKTPYMIIANHRSHMDMFLLLSRIYKIRAAANSYIAKVPLLGQVLKMSGHFVFEPGNIKKFQENILRIKESIKRNDRLVFFPEGTRCSEGFNGIQKFHMTAFQIARENNLTILPVVIHGTDKVWPKGSMNLDFSKKISIVALPTVKAAEYEDSASLARYVKNQMETKLQELAR